jgi:hypothetical protein
VREWTLHALVGIIDPPRAEARRRRSRTCREAGIEVKMITGDHASTAAAIAASSASPATPITGAELDKLDDDELAARIDDITVFARVTPSTRSASSRALQRRGNVVAMTGDGVNDAPALKAADIGVAMGITGTEVTRRRRPPWCSPTTTSPPSSGPSKGPHDLRQHRQVRALPAEHQHRRRPVPAGCDAARLAGKPFTAIAPPVGEHHHGRPAGDDAGRRSI